MNLKHLARLSTLACLLSACLVPVRAAEPLAISSPDGRIRAEFELNGRGQPLIAVQYRGLRVATLEPALEVQGTGRITEGLQVRATQQTAHDETYPIAVGKASTARDQHQEIRIELAGPAGLGKALTLVIRAFDDGVAYRQEITQDDRTAPLIVTQEPLRLAFPGDPRARLLPLANYTTSYENYYETRPVSQIGASQLVGLPLLLEQPGPDGRPVWMSVTEANLKDYAGLYLTGVPGAGGTLEGRLSPLPGRADGAKVVARGSAVTPWRILMVADNPGRFLESNIVFHLSDPCAIADTSWIRPGKTTFPWWNGYALEGVDFQPGVNTATMKHYIDFCAEQGIPYHSLDGLDIAWYGGPIAPDGPTDVTKAAPSIDMPELLRYAREKGVRLRLWMHWKALKPQIDEAFRTYEQWGIEGVMVDFMDRDDQEMVRFYYEMAEKAAKHHLTVTLHGAYKPTGMERAWPNVLNYEAALNQEYNKWDAPRNLGTPPVHNLDIALIRMIAGPLDYHQGGMRNVLPEDYRFRNEAPFVQGTRGHQLAMFVVYQNHLPMLADYPAAYRGQAGLDFLVEVPASWDETRVLVAELGKCVVVARRKGATWYLGGMAGDSDQPVELPLDFLGPYRHKATLYLDNPGGGPTAIEKVEQITEIGKALKLRIPRAGGFAGRLELVP